MRNTFSIFVITKTMSALSEEDVFIKNITNALLHRRLNVCIVAYNLASILFSSDTMVSPHT